MYFWHYWCKQFLFTFITRIFIFLKRKCLKMMKIMYKSIQRIAFDNGLQNKKIRHLILITLIVLIYVS